MIEEVWWSVALAGLGVVVSGLAALYEFVIKGRKRLGYRVQMDTTATDVVRTAGAGALEQLQQDGRPLADPTLVLLRIENNGASHIDTRDYAVLDDDKVGIRVRFPGRTVAGMVITELSDDFLHSSFGEGSGLAVRDGVIELPKVPLNRAAHYKVLAALDRAPGHTGDFPDPEVVGGIKGGIGGGRITGTRSRIGTPRRTIALVGFLVVLLLGQLVVFLRSTGSSPLDCATGRLALAGSTAFEPILRDAAASYADTCDDARFTFAFAGSSAGVRALHRARSADMLAFSDGPKDDGYPRLLPRPIAFFLFSLAVSEDAGVEDLSLRTVREIYAGEVRNWSEVGGNDLPVILVSRNPGSGTRTAFQQRVLGGVREPDANSDDCRRLDPGARPGVVRCARDTTADLLAEVRDIPGALGYAETSAASAVDGVRALRLGGHPAELELADHGAYPFWETEYAYTYGEPGEKSLAASFLRYLTAQVGSDILRRNGTRPCHELQNPVLCRPESAPR